jgi:muramoyltetrapeptide carboxypeptidase
MATPIRLPKPLVSGDHVAVVAASSCLEGEEALARLDAGIGLLESWGLVVERKPLRTWGYLAGNDHERRADLRLERPGEEADFSLLACVRGGWGSARLLERPLPMAPTWLLGFSDVTSLLWAQVAQGHGGAIHGPLLTSLAAEPEWSQQRLRSLLFGEPLADLVGESWCSGLTQGPLLVANLTVATHLLGTPHLPDLEGAILILEDVGEAPYRIERMLTHWRLCGALQRLAGIGLGSFSGCDDTTTPERSSFSLDEVLRERTADLGIPVVANLPIGHGDCNAALPLGVAAQLDGTRGRLSLVL